MSGREIKNRANTVKHNKTILLARQHSKTCCKQSPLGNDFLLEIGAEEIPAGFIEPALGQLKRKAQELLSQERLAFEAMEVMATPRRLTLLVKGLADRQEKAYETKWGPSKTAAFDAQGNPTRVYEGFKKSQGAKDEQIQIKDREARGEYLCLVTEKPARVTKEVLPQILPGLITSIQFPKTMRWDGTLSFARPVRWLLAIYGKEKIKFKLGNLTADNVTYGHRMFSPGPFRPKDIKEYFALLKKAGIILDQRRRKENIHKQLCLQAEKIGALKEFNQDLLEEVNNLVESPVAVGGRFKEEYLKLPSDVLTTSMGKNQKLFCFSSKEGLLPNFAAVLNGRLKNTSQVSKNIEAVLEAKLKDSQFFYQEDTKTQLQDKVEALKKVVFQQELGTLYNKTSRMSWLADQLSGCGQQGLSEKELENLKRALYLSKADLVTQMVMEFPVLQGVMGREYARFDGEPEEVAAAIGEQYLPRGGADKTPAGLLGALVSIIDKIDNIAGCFFLGQEPSGSYDPYALKRQASGIIKIILDKKLCLSLEAIIGKSVLAMEGYSSNIAQFGQGDKTSGQKAELKKTEPVKCSVTGQKQDLSAGKSDPVGRKIEKSDEVQGKIIAFFRERIYNLLTESGFRYDLINAVLASGYDDVLKVWDRLKQLNDIIGRAEFEQARTVIERTNNILKGTALDFKTEVQEDKFIDDLERQLWAVYKEEHTQIEQFIAEGKYKEATLAYGRGFYEIIHRFFDQVMVNAEDQCLRNNRLCMMKHINRLYTDNVADLAKIVVARA